MKSLLFLVIIQTIGILFLAYKAVATDSPAVISAEVQRPAPAKSNSETAGAHSITNPEFPGETRLRQIIREELEAYAALDANSSKRPDSYAETTTRNNAEYRYQKEYVERQIAYFKSLGEISNSDMQEMQREIVKLNTSDRQEMLNKLIQALNSGEIKGQLY